MQHHVDPFTLPADRLVNLAYFLLVQHRDAKGVRELDDHLDRAARRASLSLATLRREVPTVDRRSLPPPSWWKGEEHAAMLGVEMMRRLDSGQVRGT